MKVGDGARWRWGSGTATGRAKEACGRKVTRRLEGSGITRNGPPMDRAPSIGQEGGILGLASAVEKT